jgi:hypothetical protein
MSSEAATSLKTLEPDWLDYIFSKGVFFAVHDIPCHATLCLVEGLVEMGIPVFSNQQVPGAQFHEFRPDAFALHVFNMTEKTMHGPVLPFVANFARREKILLSMADTNTIIFPENSFPSLMTHENRFLKLAGNRHPWAFGISRTTLEKTKNRPPFGKRQRVVLRNFRPSANQDIRNLLDYSLLEALEKHIAVDRRIGEDHFDRLQKNLACLAYGGSILSDYSGNPFYDNSPAYKTFQNKAKFAHPLVVTRWDSWRFWESLAAGCLTFHLDFEKYGFLLPEMPVAWKHYIPIDMADPLGTVERFMDSESCWEEIASDGREWALQHYSPKAVAQRLLKVSFS